MTRRPRLLTIAGSDSGGGAGIQADLKTFSAFGAYGMSVVTAVTAQNTVAVERVETLPSGVIEAQIRAVLDDIGVDAIKIGMLATVPIVEVVARALANGPPVPIVLDPVMVAKSGDALLDPSAVEALRDLLLPHATLLTPNLPEAERLSGLPVSTDPERVEAAKALASARRAVLIKGGHATGETLVDLLWHGDAVERFEHPRQSTRSTHGTGCTLSSAIAAGLGHGRPLAVAVGEAIDYLTGAIRAAFPLGRGQGPVDHLYLQAPLREEHS